MNDDKREPQIDGLRVVHRMNLPTRLPFWQTIVTILVFDRLSLHGPFKVPVSVIILAGVMYGLWWFIAVSLFFKEKGVPIFIEGKGTRVRLEDY